MAYVVMAGIVTAGRDYVKDHVKFIKKQIKVGEVAKNGLQTWTKKYWAITKQAIPKQAITT